ncbi:hypothetical protein VPH35_008219 [Triticum aestivum]
MLHEAQMLFIWPLFRIKYLLSWQFIINSYSYIASVVPESSRPATVSDYLESYMVQASGLASWRDLESILICTMPPPFHMPKNLNISLDFAENSNRPRVRLSCFPFLCRGDIHT